MLNIYPFPLKGSIREFDFKLFEVSHIRLKWQERFIDRSILQAIEYVWLPWLLLGAEVSFAIGLIRPPVSNSAVADFSLRSYLS